MRTTPHELPKLPYGYDALEPYVSKQIMELHHMKHHKMFVDMLNSAEEAYDKAESTRERMAIQSALRFNGGGHLNHSLFWMNLAPPSDKNKGNGGVLKDGPFKDAINKSFGDCDTMRKEFNKMTSAIQGSGWGWVGYNPLVDQLELIPTHNQDPLLTHIPIIGVDIWEHSYYLQYFNEKDKYLENIWKCINFEEAEKRYREARKQKTKKN